MRRLGAAGRMGLGGAAMSQGVRADLEVSAAARGCHLPSSTHLRVLPPPGSSMMRGGRVTQGLQVELGRGCQEVACTPGATRVLNAGYKEQEGQGRGRRGVGIRDGALRCRALGPSGGLAVTWGVESNEKLRGLAQGWRSHVRSPEVERRPRVWSSESSLGAWKSEGSGHGVPAQ